MRRDALQRQFSNTLLWGYFPLATLLLKLLLAQVYLWGQTKPTLMLHDYADR